jgi:hypothetical protein
MERTLIFNWHPSHDALRRALADGVDHPGDVLDTGKGWTYVTFVKPGTRASEVLFDIDRLDRMARENGYYLPRDVVARHNKVVVTARSPEAGPSAQLFALVRFLEAFARRHADPAKAPVQGFYGKLGGSFDRRRKGRVLVMYGENDEALLEILAGAEAVLPSVKVPGVELAVGLANGLSALPRLLSGFDDPDYRRSGVTAFKIKDPGRFDSVLDEARQDHDKYIFAREAR